VLWGGCSTNFCTPQTCDGCCENDNCKRGDTAIACGIGGQACRTCAVNNICLPDRTCGAPLCRESGNCVAFSDCCSGACTNGICEPLQCGVVVEPCNFSAVRPTNQGSCCDGLTCFAGRCARCIPDYSTCQNASDCCSGSCSQGRCVSTCLDHGKSCSSSIDCCEGLSCFMSGSNNTRPCGNTSIQCSCGRPSTCLASGLFCTESTGCCSGTCHPGTGRCG